MPQPKPRLSEIVQYCTKTKIGQINNISQSFSVMSNAEELQDLELQMSQYEDFDANDSHIVQLNPHYKAKDALRIIGRELQKTSQLKARLIQLDASAMGVEAQLGRLLRISQRVMNVLK